jgi:hypothetical protein
MIQCMKVLSKMSLIVGVLVLVGGVVMLAWGSWIAYWHYATLSTGRSAEFTNPIPLLLLAAALSAVGGFFTGLGLARPRKNLPEKPVEELS